MAGVFLQNKPEYGCRQQGCGAIVHILTIQQLSIMTGIPLGKIAYCQQADAVMGADSYEQIVEYTGMYPEDICSNIDGNWIYFRDNPEYVYIRNEETENFNQILKNSLTEKELIVLRFLLCPDKPSKFKAGYREIARKTYINVHRVRDYIFIAGEKLKYNHEMIRRHPELLDLYTQTEKDNLPIPDDDFIEELYQLNNDEEITCLERKH